MLYRMSAEQRMLLAAPHSETQRSSTLAWRVPSHRVRAHAEFVPSFYRTPIRSARANRKKTVDLQRLDFGLQRSKWTPAVKANASAVSSDPRDPQGLPRVYGMKNRFHLSHETKAFIFNSLTWLYASRKGRARKP
jgi:hypothetical protein